MKTKRSPLRLFYMQILDIAISVFAGLGYMAFCGEYAPKILVLLLGLCFTAATINVLIFKTYHVVYKQ